jgi:CubicO group peptidase (beta-lactamase class C family)
MSGSGLSTERLGRMREVMAGHVERGDVPGVVTLVGRRGEAQVEAVGTFEAGGGAPMRRDTIFRIASVTKPIVAAAAMILVEECRLRLDDPVDEWLPELADRKVLRSLDSPLDDTVPANRPISLRDLLTFRLGIGAIMVFPPQHPIQAAMEEVGLAPGPYLPTKPADEVMAGFASLPLAHQPGEKWLYNSGSDILGIMIARVAGQTLGGFLKERLFEPLGMKDTAFSVPAAKLDRLPTAYMTDQATGGLAVFDEARGGRFASPPVFESGAGGLVSTADDLFAFAQMMLNGGTHGDRRILSRPSVELMTLDHITPAQKAVSAFVPGFWDNRGWGFGGSVITRRDKLEDVTGRYGWDGGYGTSWYIDPTEELVGVLLTQRLMDSPSPPLVFLDFWTTAYQAIDD